MMPEPTFEDKDEAIRYWKKLAEERKNDFDELEEMGKELESDQDRQIEQLEKENKRLQNDLSHVKNQLEKNRDTQRLRDRGHHDEMEVVCTRLQRTLDEKSELVEQVRQLEQDLDDLERKNRQLHASYEQAEELNQIEVERNALLETEISHGEKLKEIIQRLKDEKRDLKSELETKEKRWKTLEISDIKRNEILHQIPQIPSSDYENRHNGHVSTTNPSTMSSSSSIRLSKSSSIQSKTPSIQSKSSSASSRMSALSIVGDLLKKVGALETKLASCRTFVRDNSLDINQSNKLRTPLRHNYRNNIMSPKPFTPSKKHIDISLDSDMKD